MQIERYGPRKKTNPLLIGCGCLFGTVILGMTFVLIALLAFPETIKDFGLGLVGVEDLGQVNEVLNTTVQPVPQLQNPQELQSVVLNAGDYSQTLDARDSNYDIVVGEVNQVQQLQISFDEAALLAQCQQFTPICSADSSQIRNASFDLKPNAVIIHGQFEIQSGFWQDAGLVFLVQNERQLSVLGLEVGGSIFSSDSPELNAVIADAAVQINGLLQNMSAQAGGASFTLSSIIIDENTMTLIMR